jgi:uracil phosphoribosyltransferase
MKNIVEIKHPLVEHKLTHLRKKETTSKEFKEYLDEISSLMAYEVLKEIQLTSVEIETPVAKTTGKEIKDQVTIYPILRAGIGMAEGFTKMLPSIKVGHIGMYRDPETLKPVEYLFKYPANVENGRNIIIDPMVATGGSAEVAIEKLQETGMKNISFVALVTAEETIKKLAEKYSDVTFYVAAIDPILNDHGYIEPGLGDAGDRIFGTK